MTVTELERIASDVRKERAHEEFVTVESTHDKYGNAVNDHHMFDHNHPEDAFPY